jgi:hypothetical protein
MVCDLAVVLFASEWFLAAFKDARRDDDPDNVFLPLQGIDVDLLSKHAAITSNSFAALSAKLLDWFPEGDYMHTMAKDASARIGSVAGEILSCCANICTWHECAKTHNTLMASISEPWSTTSTVRGFATHTHSSCPCSFQTA